MSGLGNTFENIITKTVALVYKIKEETLDNFIKNIAYKNIFVYDKDFVKKLSDFDGVAQNSRRRINEFTTAANHNLEYDDSGYSENEKKINKIKIKYIEDFLSTLDNTLERVIELHNKIMAYIDISSNDYASVSYVTGDTDIADFVYDCDMFILNSFDSFTIITDILNKFIDNFHSNKSITKDDFDNKKFYDSIDTVTKRIYNKNNKNKSYNNVYDHLITKIAGFKSKNPSSMNVKDTFFPFLEEIVNLVYDDKIVLHFTEVVKCIDILLPKDSIKLYPLYIEDFNKKSGSNDLHVEDEYKIVFGLDIGKFGSDTDKSKHKKPPISSDDDYNRVIEKLENEIKEINNDMLRLKYRSNKQGYYTRLYKITDYRNFKTQTDREPQDFIAQIKLKNIGGKQNIGKYNYITEDSLGKAVNNNRARELANNYNQLTDKMIETEKKIGGIQKLAIHDLSKSESGYIRMRGGEQQTVNYNNLIKQYQLMAIKQNNIINELKNIKNII